MANISQRPYELKITSRTKVNVFKRAELENGGSINEGKVSINLSTGAVLELTTNRPRSPPYRLRANVVITAAEAQARAIQSLVDVFHERRHSMITGETGVSYVANMTFDPLFITRHDFITEFQAETFSLDVLITQANAVVSACFKAVENKVIQAVAILREGTSGHPLGNSEDTIVTLSGSGYSSSVAQVYSAAVALLRQDAELVTAMDYVASRNLVGGDSERTAAVLLDFAIQLATKK